MSELCELAKLYQVFLCLGEIDRTVEDIFCRANLADLIEAIQRRTQMKRFLKNIGRKLFIVAVILRSIKTLKGHY
jgi:hypothetical protein